MIVLGIETSCDETSVAIVNHDKKILALNTISKLDQHKAFGGVVPEIAARNHMDCLPLLVEKSMQEANLQWAQLDAIAATGGPGLIGGVIVGVMLAKGIAAAANKPFIAVNHLEGHALTVRLTDSVEFPYLMLLVSGGHCQLLIVEGVGKYIKLGATLDDAVGEAFDKVGKMLGLEYPAGPELEQLAKQGNPEGYNLPKPLYDEKGCNFSFSGLKTAVKRIIDKGEINAADLAASFQEVVAKILTKKTITAIKIFQQQYPDHKDVVIAGGVAANQYIKQHLVTACADFGMRVISPPIALCTDNAAMIAWVGIEKLRLGQVSDLNFEPRSRWPLYQA